MTITTHVCRGNFRSTWISEGGYEPVAEVLFGKVGYDGYFLEYNTERAGGFEPLRFVPKGNKQIVLGLVTSKSGTLEKKDDIKARIKEAEKFVALDQLCLSPQCGFASTEEGNVLTEDASGPRCADRGTVEGRKILTLGAAKTSIPATNTEPARENSMAYASEEKHTKAVLERWEDIPDPRLREVMQSAIKHLHSFVSEVRPTGAEWFEAIKFLTAIGQKCDNKRQEFILLSDIMGVSMLVDDINNRRVVGATPSTVEGPFHIPDAPEFGHGGSMADGAPGIPCFVTGTVRGLDGQPIAGAVLDLWQTDGEGLYEEQRHTAEPWMRGIYKTRADGSYSVRTVAPISYTIPVDGPVGEFFSRTNLSHMRPAHIHFAVSAPGYHYLVTHLFQKGDEFINNDVVYGVKDALIVEFVKKPPGKAPNGEQIDTPFYEVKYDFVLEQQQQALAAAE